MKSLKQTFFILAVIALTLTGCDMLKPIKVTDEDCKKLVDAQLLKYIDGVEDYDILKVRLTAPSALKNEVVSVSLLYKKDGEYKDKVLYLENTGRNIDRTANLMAVKKVENRTPKKYQDFDYSKIASNVEKALKMIETDSPEMEFKSVNFYEMYSGTSEGTQQDFFEIHVVKKGSKDYKEGKNIVTDYYEINFAVTEQGEVVYIN